MAPPVTRAVRFLSTMHTTMRPELVAQRTIFSPEHFPRFLATCCVLSSYAGYHSMEYIRNTHNREVMEAYEAGQKLDRPVAVKRRVTVVEMKRYPTWHDSRMMLRAGTE